MFVVCVFVRACVYVDSVTCEIGTCIYCYRCTQTTCTYMYISSLIIATLCAVHMYMYIYTCTSILVCARTCIYTHVHVYNYVHEETHVSLKLHMTLGSRGHEMALN